VSAQAGADKAAASADPLAAAVTTGSNSEATAALKEAASAIAPPQARTPCSGQGRQRRPDRQAEQPRRHPAWDQQLGQKIIFMAAGGEQSATMELNPPDLGPLQVVLSVNKDQATAAFSSAAPEVRQALESALPKLKEMMSEAGIQLGSATVSAGMSDQNNSAFSQQASAAQSGPAARQPPAAALAARAKPRQRAQRSAAQRAGTPPAGRRGRHLCLT
jgi:flagellar hook-length control protein FliK